MKEEFCGLCAAIPLALAGAGTTAVGATEKGSEDKKKKWLLISGAILLTLAAGITAYYLFVRKNCKSCKSK